MIWQQWVLLFFFVVNTLAGPLLVGRKREPVTPGIAAFIVWFNLIFVAIVWSM